MSTDALPDRRLIRLKDAAKYPDISIETFRRKVARREIPYYKPSGLAFFDPSDLEAYIAKSRSGRWTNGTSKGGGRATSEASQGIRTVRRDPLPRGPNARARVALAYRWR